MKFKMIIQIFGILSAILLLFGIVYVNASPQMGGNSKKHISKNFVNGKFQNLVDTPMSAGEHSTFSMLYDFFFNKDKDVYPQINIPTKEIDQSKLDSNKTTITWLGHSTVLIKSKEITIITDPIFNEKSIPPLNLGPKPFPYTNTYKIDDLPKIDLVIISHDHYDHLDLETIKKLSNSTFYVPLGVKSHLIKWGIKKEQVFEFDWYDEKNYSKNTKLVFTPARHFSGRGPFNARSTLWGSWVIKLNYKKIFFSGDTGYFNEFKKIGLKYGPFDLVMLDNGQYNEAWQNIHMLPEEVVQASIDLKAKNLLPIHWSKYVLSLHSWFEPITRVTNEANKKNVSLTTPMIGETFDLEKDLPKSTWWK